MSKKNTMQEMVAAVKQHAQDNYNEGGWDSIVECYDDSDIEREIAEGGAETIEQAIAYIGAGCEVWDDHRKDIEATAF